MTIGRRPCNLKQRDMTRALKAALAAGIDIGRIEVDPAAGKFTLVTNASNKEQVNEFDNWLDNDARSA